jgi:hypothetical protein
MRVVMAQLSRPFQIGLLAVALLAAAWLVLLRPHSTNSTTPVPAPAPTAAVRTVKAAAAPTTAKPGKAKGSGSSSIYHGSAPGVQGLTRAIAKANGAVATSQQNAKRLEEKSTQASSATPTATTTAPSAPTATATPTTSTPAAKAPTTSSGSAAAGNGAAGRATSVARQHAVEAQLAKGRTVLILFWDPKGADDQSVHSALRSLRSQHSLNIDIQEASAGQVASFGTITRGLQVYGTPTLLIVDKKGQAKTLTGLQDAFAISQAIREVQHSS